jgi:hypothetical protein
MKGPLSSAHGMQLWGACAAALLSLSLVLTTAALDAALADKVGVAAAVNPDAFSSLAGTPKNGPGKPVMRETTAADINFILAMVSGKKTKLAGKTIAVKGQRWPYYYGFSRAADIPISPSSGSSITTEPPATLPAAA